MTSAKNKRACKECGRDFTASPKWDYDLCEAYSDRDLREELESAGASEKEKLRKKIRTKSRVTISPEAFTF